MKSIHDSVMSETNQSFRTRKSLYNDIEEGLDGRALLTLFTSFNNPSASIDDNDCDILQNLVQRTDTSKGIVLMINSPGGDGLAAERIVETLRSYSGTNDYFIIVAGKAKSAATIISFGASKIMMPPTAELGPVDPQIFVSEGSQVAVHSAHTLVNGYDRLFKEAVATSGRLEPYLQQLEKYDDREINKYRSILRLSEDIAVKLLKSGMLKGKTEKEIKEAVSIFLNPDAGSPSRRRPISHGRPIYGHEARACGLTIDDIDISSAFWEKIYELYIRLELYVTSHVAKAVECKEDGYYASNS